MTIDVGLSREMRSMVDASTGTVSRQIFSDAKIFQLEMERIFARVELCGPRFADPEPGRLLSDLHR